MAKRLKLSFKRPADSLIPNIQKWAKLKDKIGEGGPAEGWDDGSPEAFDDPQDELDQLMDEPDDLSEFEETASKVSPSQLIEMKRSRDAIGSTPGPNRTSTYFAEPVQRILKMPLYKSIKGLGYCKPGSPFTNVTRTLSHEFSFDLAAPIGVRTYCGTYWRHTRAGYIDSEPYVLSPTARARTVEGVALTTPCRVGSSTITSTGTVTYVNLYSSTNLFDLEVASWNAKAIKFVSDTGASVNGTGTPTQVPLGVYQDCKPDLDHSKISPFPSGTSVIAIQDVGQTTGTILPVFGDPVNTTQNRPPFLVNLGAGIVSFTCLNRRPVGAQVEFVVLQIRDNFQNINTSDLWDKAYSDYCNTTTNIKYNCGAVLSSDTAGAGGKTYNVGQKDCLFDPDYKFLSIYPKYASTIPPMKEIARQKFVLNGGSNKTVQFTLPPQIYDAYKNRTVGSDPFATTPDSGSLAKLQTYVIMVAVNGVVMPLFTQPVTNTNNGPGIDDLVNIAVVDRQTCGASVMFTGTYTEHPKPCISTAGVRTYNNKPQLQDCVVTNTSYNLVAGFVNPRIPIPVANHGSLVVATQLMDSSAVTTGKMETMGS